MQEIKIVVRTVDKNDKSRFINRICVYLRSSAVLIVDVGEP